MPPWYRIQTADEFAAWPKRCIVIYPPFSSSFSLFPLLLLKINKCMNKYFIYSEGLSLARWRDFVPEVVNSINRFNKKTLPKSRIKLLTEFFTRKTVHLPNLEQFFKFNLDEEVLVDLSTLKRKEMNYKWSLHPGKKIETWSFLIFYSILFYSILFYSILFYSILPHR